MKVEARKTTTEMRKHPFSPRFAGLDQLSLSPKSLRQFGIEVGGGGQHPSSLAGQIRIVV